MAKKPKPPDDPEQSKRFEEAAKELEAEKNKGAFERALDVVVRPPSEHPPSNKSN